MSFITGLSGLRGSKTHLDAVGNNVANAGTTAFKSSRVEFGDVYSTSYLSQGKTDVGSGVTVERVAQLKTQGHVALTNKPLDMGIDGRGYFMVDQNGTKIYTRDGTWRVNKDGFITDNTGGFLQGYGLDKNGNVETSLGKIYVPQTNIVGKATTHANIEFNLSAQSPVKSLEREPFDPKDANTYNYANVTKIYDSMGVEHDLRYFFVKTGQYENPQEALRDGINNANMKYPMTTWTVFTALDGQLFDSQGNVYDPQRGDQARNAQMTLSYDSNGLLQGVAKGGSHLNRALMDPSLNANQFPAGGLTRISGTGTTNATLTNPNPAPNLVDSRWRDGTITYTSQINPPAAAAADGSTVTAITGPGFKENGGGTLVTTYTAPTGTNAARWTLELRDGATVIGTPITTTTNNGTAVFTKPDGSTYRVVYSGLGTNPTNTLTFSQTPQFTYTPKDTGVPVIGTIGTAGTTVEFYGDPATNPKGFRFTIPADSQNEFHHGAVYALQTVGVQSASSTLEGFSGENRKLTFNMANLTPGATYGRLDNNNVGSDTIDFKFASTQTSNAPNFSSVIQDGYPPGVMNGTKVSKDGILSVYYSNNQSRDIAKIPLVTFRNEDGLKPIGSNAYIETKESGAAIINDATAGPNGAIKDKHLELSNVDLAEELVQMIIAQRNFQANAKTIQTEDAVTQTVINLR